MAQTSKQNGKANQGKEESATAQGYQPLTLFTFLKEPVMAKKTKKSSNVAKKLLKDARALYKATQKEHNKLFFAMEKLEAKARALRAKADAKMDELMQLSEIIDKFQAKRNRKSKAKSKK